MGRAVPGLWAVCASCTRERQEPPARASRSLCLQSSPFRVLPTSAWTPLGSSQRPVLQFSNWASPWQTEGVPHALCLQWVTGVSVLPRRRGVVWSTVGSRLFQKMIGHWSFCLAQAERTAGWWCCLLMCCWAALCSERFWPLHCGWQTVIKPSMSAPLLGNGGTVPGI